MSLGAGRTPRSRECAGLWGARGCRRVSSYGGAVPGDRGRGVPPQLGRTVVGPSGRAASRLGGGLLGRVVVGAAAPGEGLLRRTELSKERVTPTWVPPSTRGGAGQTVIPVGTKALPFLGDRGSWPPSAPKPPSPPPRTAVSCWVTSRDQDRMLYHGNWARLWHVGHPAKPPASGMGRRC